MNTRWWQIPDEIITYSSKKSWNNFWHRSPTWSLTCFVTIVCSATSIFLIFKQKYQRERCITCSPPKQRFSRDIDHVTLGCRLPIPILKHKLVRWSGGTASSQTMDLSPQAFSARDNQWESPVGYRRWGYCRVGIALHYLKKKQQQQQQQQKFQKERKHAFIYSFF